MAIATPCNEADCTFPKCNCWDRKLHTQRLIVKQQERIVELEASYDAVAQDCTILEQKNKKLQKAIQEYLDCQTTNQWVTHFKKALQE